MKQKNVKEKIKGGREMKQITRDFRKASNEEVMTLFAQVAKGKKLSAKNRLNLAKRYIRIFNDCVCWYCDPVKKGHSLKVNSCRNERRINEALKILADSFHTFKERFYHAGLWQESSNSVTRYFFNTKTVENR